jgi:hypothetical protein
MPSSESILIQAWRRSEGKCECTKANHNHEGGRCNAALLWTIREGKLDSGCVVAWKPILGMHILANCEIRCAACHGLEFIWLG